MLKKIKLILILIFCGFIVVWFRLIYLQLYSYREFSHLAQTQYQSLSQLLPRRGRILAADGSVLALSSASTSSQFIRSYPEGSQSAYLTGILGKDQNGVDIGYFGLEGFYDRQLKGKAGRVDQETDIFNRPMLIGKSDIVPVQNGSDLVTSIDPSLQYFAQQSLITGLAKYQAAGGTISIMQSSTGRILAMVSYPSYDPNFYTQYQTAIFKNPIVSDAYEPGSTFKPLVMAAALDAKAVSLDTICHLCAGPYTIGDATIKSWDNQYYPQSNLYDIILHSDNVGMSFVSQKLGKTKLLAYLKNLGFGKKTGIDLQEENTPSLRPDNQWYPIDLATASFGQGIAVTRLQMITAINSLANRGVLIPPSIVTQIISPQGSQNTPIPKSRRVYSREAASKVVDMMVNGVEKGEVRYYRPQGYLIAGKTGTAQVPIAGHYDPNRFISSFVGFAPADKPLFTMLVTLDNPQSSPWGSTTAAPLWFSLAQKIFQYYQIPPND